MATITTSVGPCILDFIVGYVFRCFFSARRTRQYLQLQDRETVEEKNLSLAVQEVFEDVFDNAKFFPPSDDRDKECSRGDVPSW